jgi:DNA topoisomerase VI subunit B
MKTRPLTAKRVRGIARTAFTTSRLLEFCTVEELTKLIGCTPEAWPVVFVKEGVDNALDACEEGDIAPEITIAVSTTKRTISISDNGPGIAGDSIAKLLDFTKKTSSREAYVGPTRGAQGNALQALLAMPFALDGSRGETTIQSRGIDHRITFTIDTVRREPKIEVAEQPGFVHSGTCLTARWPKDASVLTGAKERIVQIARDFPWLNPHASFTLKWDNKTLVTAPATDPAWHKWRPHDPVPAHWHDGESFNRLIAAYVADDEDHVVRRRIWRLRPLRYAEDGA